MRNVNTMQKVSGSQESEENVYYLLCFGWRSIGEQARRAVGTHIIFVLKSRTYVYAIKLVIYFRV